MYSFAERSDTRVLDEPLFGHFLAHTGVERPSRKAVLASMPTGREEALASLLRREHDDVLFLKHMANHLEGLVWEDVDGPNHAHVIFRFHNEEVGFV